MHDDYTRRLEDTIRKMLEPVRGVSFDLVMQVLTGHKVEPFDLTSTPNGELLDILIKASMTAGLEINRGVERLRPNELGNAIETLVIKALKNEGLESGTPKTRSGKARSAGYPDIYFKYNEKLFYLECKTFTPDSIDSSFRTFYFSPSNDMKVTTDAVHLLLSFETSQKPARSGGFEFTCTRFKLISLEKLELDLKYEFNSNNKRMYSGDYGARVLADQSIPRN